MYVLLSETFFLFDQLLLGIGNDLCVFVYFCWGFREQCLTCVVVNSTYTRLLRSFFFFGGGGGCCQIALLLAVPTDEC